jgi:hypothetical protein
MARGLGGGGVHNIVLTVAVKFLMLKAKLENPTVRLTVKGS